MADDTTQSAEEESQDESPVTPPAIDPAELQAQLATERKRLQGKDQALTRAQQERDQIKADRDAARARLAELEGANMSELERAQKERDEARAEALAARQEAERTRLYAAHPAYAKFEQDTVGMDAEARAAAFEALVAQPASTAPAPAPRVDHNSPRKSSPGAAPQAPLTTQQIRDQLYQTAIPGSEDWPDTFL